MEFNHKVSDLIKKRYSCRTYETKEINENTVKKLCDYIESINRTTKINARFTYITKKSEEAPIKLGTYGMIAGANNFIVGICNKNETGSVEFGYLFESIILFATDLDLQTCWLGGTFHKKDFIQKVNLQDNEFIAIVSPVGIKKEKPRIFDHAVRAFIKANNRKPFEELFFQENIIQSMSENTTDDYKIPLEMLRLAPSASNKQPWRVVKNSEGYHFYLARTKNYPTSQYDMQKNDIGIAKCHFELSAKELGLHGTWIILEKPIYIKDLEYITTWKIAK